jgi:nicotinamide-nucleotide amidase
MKSSVQKIIAILKKKKLKISFAESCTGGLLSSVITSISGSSKVFSMGLVTYSNEAKNIILKVPKQIIKKYGAVSEECCLYMTKNLSKTSKSDISLSITGIAGPNGGTKKKPIGLVYIGIKKGKKISIKKFLFKNKGRNYIQKTTVVKSLELILSLIE